MITIDLLWCRPCWTNAEFSIRNFSLTHEVGYTLRLRGGNSAYLPMNSCVGSLLKVSVYLTFILGVSFHLPIHSRSIFEE